MKRRRYEGADVRRILKSMVLDPLVCSRVAGQWVPEGLFDSEWANLIGRLIVSHFQKYGSPPTTQMVVIFESWAETTPADDKIIDAVDNFLQTISDEDDENFDSKFILDEARDYFAKVVAEKTMEAATLDLEQGRVQEAEARLRGIRNVNLGTGGYIEPAADPEEWLRSFETDKKRPLVYYRGALGDFVGDAFMRGSLYAFMAPDKTGKTTWLLDLAYRAVRARRRVVYFDTGDSNEEEIMVRLACRTLMQPEYDKTLKIPLGWDDEGGLLLVEKEMKKVNPIKGYRLFSKLAKSEDALRISCHSNGTINVDGINSILEDWNRENEWRPDIIIVDYADILAPQKGFNDPLDSIDETWKGLRRLSQDRRALVLTATQSNAAAYGKEKGLLGRWNFSGRKTKLAHVNGMLGINVSSEEKERGETRINWVVRRKGHYTETAYVSVAGNMSLGNPSIISRK